MRTRHATATWSAILLAVPLATTAASARAEQPLLVATGNEMAFPGAISPGTVRCIDGEPTGNPVFPCTPGTRQILIRDMVSTSAPANMLGPAAEFLDGQLEITNNCNLDADMRGQCWGTFEWPVLAKGGRWHGTWAGQFDMMNAATAYSCRAIGLGGDLAGLSLKYEAVMPGWSAPGVPNAIVFVANVRDVFGANERDR
jgi:hypothetical protein